VTGAFGFARTLEQAQPSSIPTGISLRFPFSRRSLRSGRSVIGHWRLITARITKNGIHAVKPGNYTTPTSLHSGFGWFAVSTVHPSGERVPIKGKLLGVECLVEFAPLKKADALLGRLLHWYGIGLQRPLHFFPAMRSILRRVFEKGEPEAVLAKFVIAGTIRVISADSTDDQDPYVASSFPSGRGCHQR